MIVCSSQGEYLEAGRIRGEYGGFNKTFVGDRMGSERYHEAIKGGLQTKKYALPPATGPFPLGDMAALMATSVTISSTPSCAGSQTEGRCHRCAEYDSSRLLCAPVRDEEW